MEFDDVLSYVGQFGRYQCLLYCGIACAIITTALRDLSVVFTLDIPDYRCAIPGLENDTFNNQNGSHLYLINVTIPADDKCNIYTNITGLNGTVQEEECSAWVYDKTIYQTTVATDFDLVCNKTILSTVINMIYGFGGLFGALFGGKLTDKFGRKIVWVTSCVGLGVAGVAFSLSTNIYMLMAFRVFEGVFGVPAYMSTFTYGKHR
ncbi:solute carrier family 22 member 19-like [Lineus longissimus]|uniref:solute carrier family 22 member 19-like n=1 Tax=Lineus longissimus TaxID=88925 RepID=UPI00315DFFA6